MSEKLTSVKFYFDHTTPQVDPHDHPIIAGRVYMVGIHSNGNELQPFYIREVSAVNGTIDATHEPNGKWVTFLVNPQKYGPILSMLEQMYPHSLE